MQKLFFILYFLLSSCSTFYNIEDNNIIKYNQPNKIESEFLINGRFFIKSNQDSYYGNFSWMHNKLEDNIDFKSPLGQIFAKLNINHQIESINLIIQQKIYTGDNVKALMQKNLGFYLPFEYLYYWVCGTIVPNYPINKYFYNGFQQFDFNVYFISWYDNNHPKVIKIIKDDKSNDLNNDMTIKLFLIWN